MKFKDRINYAYKKLRRNKKNIFYIFFMCIPLLLIIISFSFYDTSKKTLYNVLNKSLIARTFNISFYDDDEYIETSKPYTIEEKLDNIKFYTKEFLKNDGVFNSYFQTFQSVSIHFYDKDFKKYENHVMLYTIDNDKLNIVKGRKIEADNEIICPLKFYPGSMEGSNVIHLNFNDYLDTNKILNRTYKILSYSYGDFNTKVYKNYKIVGLYDNEAIGQDYNVCYTSFSTANKLILETRTVSKDSDLRYVETSLSELTNHWYNFNIEVKDYKDYEKVKEQFSKYYPEDIFKINKNTFKLFDSIVYVSSAVTGAFILISFIIYLGVVKRKINDSKKQYMILSAIGYSNKDIKKTIVTESIISSIISFIVAFILSLLIYYVANLIIYNSSLDYRLLFGVSYSLIGVLVAFIISILVSLLASLFAIKSKFSIIEEIKE